jgi:hypothetical protein
MFKAENQTEVTEMTRGGYRPGSGPRKGTKYKTRSLKNVAEPKLTPEEKEMIRQMLAMGERIKDGGTLTNTESRLLDEIGVELSNELRRMLEEFQF